MRALAQKQSQPQKSASSSLAQSNMAASGPDHPEHALLSLQRAIGNQAVQRMLQTRAEGRQAGPTAAASPCLGHDFSRIPIHPPAAGAVQTKLAINKPGDEYEQEADRLADRVMRMPAPQLQRECACGGACPTCQTEQLGEEHDRLQAKRLGSSDLGQTAVLPIVHEALRSPCQPLDPATRAFMEPRFDHDFSKVRVHVDAKAAESARAVNALAYTVGRDLVFGAGQYQPDTPAGRLLLGHELTHVIQQQDHIRTTHPLHLAAKDDAYEREADRTSRKLIAGEKNTVPPVYGAVTASLQRVCKPAAIGHPSGCTLVSGDVVGEHYLFQVNCDDFKPGEEARLRAFAGTLTSGGSVKVHGFASEEGDPTFNENLSCARAIKGQQIIDSVVAPAGVHVSEELFAHGATAGNRDERRSITIDWLPAAPTPGALAKPSALCGPDVTKQVTEAIDKTRSTFSGWSTDDKTSACHALNSVITGGFAWDIGELHNSAWILSYRPDCATERANPPCGSSVQVGSDCYYAGSVNYVIFGVMCDLCDKHFTALGSSDANDYKLGGMLKLIDEYKGTGFTGLGTPSKNFVPSKEWATAGFFGWPTTAAPAGDRTNCIPSCSKPYSDTAFTVHWVPKGWF